MPRLSRWFIRSSLIYLLLGFTLGGILLAHKGLALHPALWRVLPAHIELALFGWIVQLAMGVAFWILPRFGASRGNEWAAWLAFGLLNGGIWLVIGGAVLGGGATLVLLGRLAEASAVLAFARHAWPRIKPLGA